MGPQSSGKSTLLNHLFGTNFREMDAFRGRHVLIFVYTSSEEYLASNLYLFFRCNSLFSGLRRLREFGLLDALVLSLAPL
jgi:Fe-S cluster assembly ATPase SufC